MIIASEVEMNIEIEDALMEIFRHWPEVGSDGFYCLLCERKLPWRFRFVVILWPHLSGCGFFHFQAWESAKQKSN